MSNIRMSFFNTDSITCNFVRVPMKSRAKSQLVSDDVDRCKPLRFDGHIARPRRIPRSSRVDYRDGDDA